MGRRRRSNSLSSPSARNIFYPHGRHRFTCQHRVHRSMPAARSSGRCGRNAKGTPWSGSSRSTACCRAGASKPRPLMKSQHCAHPDGGAQEGCETQCFGVGHCLLDSLVSRTGTDPTLTKQNDKVTRMRTSQTHISGQLSRNPRSQQLCCLRRNYRHERRTNPS